VHENAAFIPEDIDYIDIDYGWIIKSVIRYRDQGHKRSRTRTVIR
jgi:hypothetical protein